MITENLSTLKINKLTQSQYDRELEAGNIDENALYLTPEEEIDLSGYATKEEVNEKADSEHTHPYLPLSGGYMTGRIYMPNNIGIKSYSKNDGDYKSLIYLGTEDNLHVGNGDLEEASSIHSGDTYINSIQRVVLKQPNGLLAWRPYSTDEYSNIFNCTVDSDAALGSPSYRWYRLFQSASTVSTSDEREKSDITSIADYPVMYSSDTEGNIFEQLFYKLVPKTYTLNVEKNNDLHIGFVAQDIEKVLEELNMPIDELGFVNHEYWTDEETGEEKDRYGLAYEEFIALNTYMIQKQKDKIKEQKDKIESLEKRIAKLEALANVN